MRLLLLLLAPALFAADFTTTILHVNDTHDRIEPTVIQGKPYGGMPRLGTLIKEHRKSDPNAIVLHAGDAFQGTFYFTVYEGLADLAFLNAIGLDAMAVGNHEFDRGPTALGTFAANAQFPLLSVNLDVDAEPALKGKFRNSTILTRGKERIGVVGAITPELPTISNPGPNVHLRDLVTSIQAEVDSLTKSGINKIILLAHVGYVEEQVLARTLHGVDVIVGGHSHTLLGTTTAPGWREPSGPYPTVIDNPDHGKTLVVQAWEGEKVLGRLQVTFDRKGRVKKWSDSQPIRVDESIAEDPTLKALVAAFQKPIAQQRDRKIGTAEGALGQNTVMGEIIADAMLAATAPQKTVAALMNTGGVRASLEPGDITFGSAIAVQPFNNTLVVMDLNGVQLKQTLEVRPVWVSKGVRYTFDATKPQGSRVSELTLNAQPVSDSATYRVVVNNFMADGGDGFIALKNSTGYRYDTGLLDIDTLVNYLGEHSPIGATPENRVRRIGN
ncbi:MAG: bifunctional metallophosphatase/5'-nucleotidase [Bryobacteraceae bacterium]